MLDTVRGTTKRHFPKYKVVSAGELGDGGAIEDWAFWSQGTYAFCLELDKDSHFNFKRQTRSATFPRISDEVEAYEKWLSDIITDLLRKKVNQPTSQSGSEAIMKPARL
jgi:hypothetical protein